MVAGEIPRSVDVLVLGGGPGGYTAAARAAELGHSVVLVERGQLGGVCLNVGCIPSKALIALGHDLDRARQRIAAGTGLTGAVDADLAAARRCREEVMARLRDGVTSIVKGAEVVTGTARFVGRDRVAVEALDHVEHFQFRHAIIATGSRPVSIPAIPFDGSTVLDSTAVLALEVRPEHLVVVGGGYIGVELGTAYRKLGSRVTIVEAADRLLAGFDADAAAVVEASLGRLGVTVRTGTGAVRVEAGGLVVESGAAVETISASHVLVAVGRVPNTDDLQLEDAGLTTASDGTIPVDHQQRTANASIFAIGDVTAGPALAHRASEQGRVAADVIGGLAAAFDQLVPLVAFTDPEIASVGHSESAAKTAGEQVVVGKASFGTNGRALTLGESDGYVKVVADRNGVLLGAQIVGPGASEMISELTVAVECALRLEDLAAAIHPHPTLGEVVVDACRRAQRRVAAGD